MLPSISVGNTPYFGGGGIKTNTSNEPMNYSNLYIKYRNIRNWSHIKTTEIYPTLKNYQSHMSWSGAMVRKDVKYVKAALLLAGPAGWRWTEAECHTGVCHINKPLLAWLCGPLTTKRRRYWCYYTANLNADRNTLVKRRCPHWWKVHYSSWVCWEVSLRQVMAKKQTNLKLTQANRT